METLIRWLVKRFMKDFHLAKNPPRGMKKGKIEKNSYMGRMPPNCTGTNG